MTRSREISQYFEVNLSEFPVSTPIPCDIHLYFAQNFHLMTWKRTGEELTAEFVAKYADRGIRRVWIHRDDAELFYQWANPEIARKGPSDEGMVLANKPGASAHTEEGAFIAGVMASDQIEEDEKKKILEAVAGDLLGDLAAAETPEQQEIANKKAQRVVKDILAEAASETSALVAEIWKLANVDPDLEHAVTVSTYTVIFAMAFGKIGPELVADLALAALLHDVGLCQVTASVTKLPWNAMPREERSEYEKHVELGLSLIESYAPEVPKRTQFILRQHHEKFDGTGYPRKLQGFDFDDISQLLAMADLIDSICTGQWDGTRRSMRETFEVVSKLEKTKTFPQFFNPEIFSSVMKWTQGGENREAMESVSKTVAKQSKLVLKKSA